MARARKSPTAPEQRFVVANPRGIPAGVPILTHRTRGEDGAIVARPWFEGDAIAESDLPAEAWARFTGGGFIVEEPFD